MNPSIDIRVLAETSTYAVWMIDDFDLNSLETRAEIPAYNRINGVPFSYATVHAVRKSGSWSTGTLSVMVSNEADPARQHDMIAHPESISRTAGGAGWASAPFQLSHYWLGFQPTLVEGSASILKLFVMLRGGA